MTAVTNDISFEGFQAFGAQWVSFLGSRLFTTLRAGSARVDVLGVDVSFNAGGGPVTTSFTGATVIQIWRCSIGQKDPPNIAPSFGIAPAGSTSPVAGFEQLFNKRISAFFQASGTQSSSSPTQCSGQDMRFPPGVMSAKAGQQLFVVAAQP